MLDDSSTSSAAACSPIFVIIIVVVLIVAYIGSRYKVAGANEALVVSGQRDKAPGRPPEPQGRARRRGHRPAARPQGRQAQADRAPDQRRTSPTPSPGRASRSPSRAWRRSRSAPTTSPSATPPSASSRPRSEEVDSIVKNVLEGSLRSIVGTLTVEELNLDRQKFQQAVQDAAQGDLATSGLQIDSFTIQAIRDESGYMELIGQQETARRERDARMAKAAADQEAAVREAEAEQVKINAARDVSLRRAETETQTAAAQARAAQAGPLAEAEATQEVTRKQTELAELEAARKEKELLDQHRPARRGRGRGADPPSRGREGAAHRAGPGRGRAGQARRRGRRPGVGRGRTPRPTAKRTTLEGNAEAGITFTKGEAEAKALALRAEAYRQFNEAAIIQTVLSMMPEIVRAAAEPLGNIDTLTVLSNDGASDIVRNVTRTVTEANATVKGLTGIDIPASSARRSAAPGAAGRPGPAGPAGAAGRVRRAAPTAAGPGAGRRDRRQPRRRVAGRRPRGIGHGADLRRRHRARDRRPTDGQRGDLGDAGERPPRRRRGSRRPKPSTRRWPPPTRRSAPPRDATDARGRTPAAGPPGRRRPARADITPETTVDEAARRLASDLRAVPGIERFAAVRLADLERRAAPAADDVAGRPRAAGPAVRPADDRRADRPLRRWTGPAGLIRDEQESWPGMTDGGAEYARLLDANERYSESFDRSALTAAPLSGLAIVACMDARLDIGEALGLRTGDAHVIRNAGGLVTDDVIRSLIVSQQLLGTNEIVVIQHTGCGLHDVDEDALRERLAAAVGVTAEDIGLEFGGFTDLATSVRTQVALLREHQLLRRVPVHGLVFDVLTGRLHEVA